MTLILPRVELSTNAEVEYMTLMKSKQLISLPYRKIYSQYLNLGNQTTFNSSILNISTNETPTYVCVAVQYNAAYTDAATMFKKSQAVFPSCNINDISIDVNGERYPRQSTNYNANQTNLQKAYKDFNEMKSRFNGQDAHILGDGSPISYNDFIDYSCIHCIRLENMPVIKGGNLDLKVNMSFHSAEPRRAIAVIFSERVATMQGNGNEFILSA
jgi:hypothetical protein